MSGLTLESLAKRVEALERALADQLRQPGRDDWRSVVGLFADSKIMPQIEAEGRAIREAEREAARRGESPE